MQVNAITLKNGWELTSAQIEKDEMMEVADKDKLEKAKGKQEEGKKVSRKVVKKNMRKPLYAYIPRVPYPQRLKGANNDSDFSKIIKILKPLHINISFIDGILQVPSYAKFLKGIIMHKRKIEKHEVIAHSE